MCSLSYDKTVLPFGELFRYSVVVMVSVGAAPGWCVAIAVESAGTFGFHSPGGVVDSVPSSNTFFGSSRLPSGRV